MNNSELAAKFGTATWDELAEVILAVNPDAQLAKPAAALQEAAEHARQHLRLSSCAVDTVDPDCDFGPVGSDTVAKALTRAVNAGLSISRGEGRVENPDDVRMVLPDGGEQYLSGELTEEEFGAAIAFAAVEVALLEQAAADAGRRAAVLVAIYNGATVVVG